MRDEYKVYATTIENSMDGNRLNRHKICACMCLAIMKVYPFSNETIDKQKHEPLFHVANEFLAIDVSMSLLFYYIKYHLSVESGVPFENLGMTKLHFPKPILHESPIINILVKILHTAHVRKSEVDILLFT